jgi:hypothetical protein
VDRSRYQRLAEQHAGVIHQIARTQAIAAIEHDVVVGENLACVGGAQLGGVGAHGNFRVQSLKSFARHFSLWSIEAVDVE